MARQARKTASQVAQKWATNLANSTNQIQQGVNAVTTSPTALAAANPTGYLQGIQRAVSSGKWQANLQAVSLQDWKTAMVQKGIPHIQTGAAQSQQKVATKFTPLLDFIYNTRDSVNSSNPRGTLQQNIQRMNAFVQAMAGYKSGG